MSSSFKEQIKEVRSGLSDIRNRLNSVWFENIPTSTNNNNITKLPRYRVELLDYVRNEIFNFNEKNSKFFKISENKINYNGIKADISTISTRTNNMLYNSKTINSKIDVTVPDNFIEKDFQGSIVAIKDEANLIESDLNNLNSKLSSINLTKFSEDYDYFINNFDFEFWKEKVNTNLLKIKDFDNFLIDIDKLLVLSKSVVDKSQYLLEKLMNVLYPNINKAPISVLDLYKLIHGIKTNPPETNIINVNPVMDPKLYGIFDYLTFIYNKLNHNNIEMNNFKISTKNVQSSFIFFNNNIKNIIDLYEIEKVSIQDSSKNKILGLSQTKITVSDLKENINIIKKATPLTHSLATVTIDADFKKNFMTLRDECIRVYNVFEKQAITMCNNFIIENEIILEDKTEYTHYAIFGPEYFGGLLKLFKLVENKEDILSIKQLYSTFNFEKFYSTLIYYLEVNKKFRITFDIDKLNSLFLQLKSSLTSYAYSLRRDFNNFVNESQFNFYNSLNIKTDKNIIDSTKNEMDLVFYTLNFASPQGVSNSRLEYDGITVNLNDEQIKDVKLPLFRANISTQYNFKLILKNNIFGLENNKSPQIEVDMEIALAMKNNLLPKRSYISPNYQGAAIIFGYGKIDDFDNKLGFFLSVENITEVKLNTFKVDGYEEYTDLYLFIDHDIHQNNPLQQTSTFIKLENEQYTQKTCLYNSKPINGMYEFGLLELTALAHDSKYSEMTLEELVQSGISNLTLSNLYYYVNNLPENGVQTEIDPDVNKSEIKSKYLIRYAEYLKPLLSNWISKDLYEMSSEDIDAIVYDFCSVYMNSVFDDMVKNFLKYEETMAYNSEFLLEPRLENQIKSKIPVYNSLIEEQIFNNNFLPEVKIEFRTTCREFMSEVFNTSPISNKELQAKEDMMKIYDTLFSDSVSLFRNMLELAFDMNVDGSSGFAYRYRSTYSLSAEQFEEIYTILLNGPFNQTFNINIKSIIDKFSKYGITEIEFQDNMRMYIEDLPNDIRKYLLTIDFSVPQNRFYDNTKYEEIYNLVNSSTTTIISMRI